jgi:hypothetical protein
LAGNSAGLSSAYTIHPSSRALALASFQARARNSAWVIGAAVVLPREVLGEKLRQFSRLMIGHRVARARQRDDDLVVDHF